MIRMFVHGTLFLISASAPRHDMCYSVCGMMHINDPLLLIEKSSPCSGASGVPLYSLNGVLQYVQYHK